MSCLLQPKLNWVHYTLSQGKQFILEVYFAEMGHKQPKTPVQTDNSTAEGLINNKIQSKRTKSMDMRFHWLRDRACQGTFRFYWRPGPLNWADYWTKHHPAAHHKHIRNEFLTQQKVLEVFRNNQKMQQKSSAAYAKHLRGCADPIVIS